MTAVMRESQRQSSRFFSGVAGQGQFDQKTGDKFPFCFLFPFLNSSVHFI